MRGTGQETGWLHPGSNQDEEIGLEAGKMPWGPLRGGLRDGSLLWHPWKLWCSSANLGEGPERKETSSLFVLNAYW